MLGLLELHYGRWSRVELDGERFLCLVHQFEQLCPFERRRFEEVIWRAWLEAESEFGGLVPERRAGQDRQVEDLNVAVQVAVAQVAERAHHRFGRVARQADDQIDLHADALVTHRPDAALESLQVVLPVHQAHRVRVDRLQPDLDLGEVGRAEQPGRFGRDALGPQFAEITEGVAPVLFAQEPEEVGEILALVECRIEKENFLRAALVSVPERRAYEIRCEVVLLVVALGVVAELALEHAPACGLQQEHPLVGSVQDTRKVRRSERGQIRQWRTERRTERRIVSRSRDGRYVEPRNTAKTRPSEERERAPVHCGDVPERFQ